MSRTPYRWLHQIRRRWKIVVAVTLIVMAGAAMQAFTATSSYVGKSSLTLIGRGPQEDTPMAVGYLNIFNDPATIDRLTAARGLPDNVTYEARTAAASPIVIIEATADNATVAQDAAAEMAEAFKDDINDVQGAGRATYVAELERQLADQSPVLPDNSPNLYYSSLRDRIDSMRADQTNMLIGLQPRAGVEKRTPKIAVTLVSGLVGGVLLGGLAALCAAALSRRVTCIEDIQDQTSLPLLAELPRKGDRISDDRQLRMFVNSLGSEAHSGLRTITVTDCGKPRDARVVADTLSALIAAQGNRTVSVHADGSPVGSDAGVNEVFAGSASVGEVLQDSGVGNLKVMSTGAAVDDRYSMITRERVTTVIGELQSSADVIVVSAPPMGESETQLLCAAADATVLVLRKGSTLKGDVASAEKALQLADAKVLGLVIVRDA